jgi:hypothetical protein
LLSKCNLYRYISGGDILASMSTDGVVVLTDVRMMTPVRKVTSPCPLMGCCAVRLSGQGAGAGAGDWLAMCGRDGSVRAMAASGVGGTKTLKPSSAAGAVGGCTSWIHLTHSSKAPGFKP